jgi:hypothetical protein
MFFIPAAIFATGAVTWPAFLLNNLLPVTVTQCQVLVLAHSTPAWLVGKSRLLCSACDSTHDCGQEEESKHNLSIKNGITKTTCRCNVGTHCHRIANTIIESLLPTGSACKMVIIKNRSNEGIGDNYLKITNEN